MIEKVGVNTRMVFRVLVVAPVMQRRRNDKETVKGAAKPERKEN